MKNKEQLSNYKKTGHLLNKKIVCTECTTHVTMFGSNLENRIKKFGTIENLLETFKCRTCVSASKPKKEKKVSVRKLKKEKKEEIKKMEIPKMKFSIPRDVFLKDAPDIIQAMTSENVCASPNYYLDHKRSCDGCTFFSNCHCALKAA